MRVQIAKPVIIDAEFTDLREHRYKKQYRVKRSKSSQQYSNNKYSYNPGSSKKKIKKQGFAHPLSAFLTVSGLAILVGTLLFGDFLNANKNLLRPPYKHIQSCWR